MGVVTIGFVLLSIWERCSTVSILTHDDPFAINITMNGYQTTKEDEYAFVRYTLPDEELFVVGYSPLVVMNVVHHMITYACSTLGSSQSAWVGGLPCGRGDQIIIHAWDCNAPAQSLPKDTGFAVGRNTSFKHIVVNIHYLIVVKNDFSGNQILLSRKPRKYRAGVVVGGTSDIYLKAKTHTIRTPFSCRYRGPPVSIFAGGVHTHRWGRVGSLYRIRDETITQIVKGDPQRTRSYYLLPSPVDIQDGDAIVGQCVYDNDDDRAIQIGSTHNDEMCNVLVMYSLKSTDDQQHVVTAPPSFCWGNSLSEMTRLIPSDSEVPPIKSAEMSLNNDGHDQHAKHAMNVSPDLPSQTMSLASSLEEKIFRISLMMAVTVAVLLAVIVGCVMRMKNLQKLHCHRDFKRVEQFSDGENEPLDNRMDDDSAEEITTIPSNGSTIATKNPTF